MLSCIPKNESIDLDAAMKELQYYMDLYIDMRDQAYRWKREAESSRFEHMQTQTKYTKLIRSNERLVETLVDILENIKP